MSHYLNILECTLTIKVNFLASANFCAASLDIEKKILPVIIVAFLGTS